MGFFRGVVLVLSCLVVSSETVSSQKQACEYPVIYNFCDSNSDTGGMLAAFVPIPSPYGLGFFHKAGGRDFDGRLIVDFIVFADPFKICCGYHVNDSHVWCGNKGSVDNTDGFGSSCDDPSAYISWDGVHYNQAANRFIADLTLNGSLAEPQIPITQACHRQ